jgi:hypothetical protein
MSTFLFSDIRSPRSGLTLKPLSAPTFPQNVAVGPLLGDWTAGYDEPPAALPERDHLAADACALRAVERTAYTRRRSQSNERKTLSIVVLHVVSRAVDPV